MDAKPRRPLVALASVVVALAAGVLVLDPLQTRAGPLSASDTLAVSAEVRAAGLRFAPTVSDADRGWILGVVAAARPEAQRLIGEIDGLIELRTHEGDPLGVTLTQWRAGDASFVVDLDIASLDGRRTMDRENVVMHELGHAIDHALVPQATNAALDRGIPRSGRCISDGGALSGSCAEVEERFADTFAKWALRGRVSAAGAGYGIASPASLEDWGAPLGLLAARLDAG